MKLLKLLITLSMGLGALAHADGPCGSYDKIEYFCTNKSNKEFNLAVCTNNSDDQVSTDDQEYGVIESEVDHNMSSFYYQSGLEAAGKRIVTSALGSTTFKISGEMIGELVITREVTDGLRKSKLTLLEKNKNVSQDLLCRYIGKQVNDEYYGD